MPPRSSRSPGRGWRRSIPRSRRGTRARASSCGRGSASSGQGPGRRRSRRPARPRRSPSGAHAIPRPRASRREVRIVRAELLPQERRRSRRRSRRRLEPTDWTSRLGSPRGLPHLREPRLDGRRVALGTHALRPFDLPSLRLGVEAVELHLVGIVLGEAVDADDDALARLHLLLEGVRGLLDLRCWKPCSTAATAPSSSMRLISSQARSSSSRVSDSTK